MHTTCDLNYIIVTVHCMQQLMLGKKRKKRESDKSYHFHCSQAIILKKTKKKDPKKIITLIIKGAHSNRISTNQTMIIII